MCSQTSRASWRSVESPRARRRLRLWDGRLRRGGRHPASAAARVRAVPGRPGPPPVRVVAQACEEALRLAEAGGGDDPARLRALLAECLSAAAGCEATILGCTDFTCVRPVLEEVNRGRTLLIDPAEAAVEQLHELLQARGLLSDGTATVYRFCLTAPDATFAQVGRSVFGLPI